MSHDDARYRTYLIEMDDNMHCEFHGHTQLNWHCIKEENFRGQCKGDLKDRPENCPMREITSEGSLKE